MNNKMDIVKKYLVKKLELELKYKNKEIKLIDNYIKEVDKQIMDLKKMKGGLKEKWKKK